MAINYTATSAITARVTTTAGYADALEEEEVTLLAFGWADAQPETTTGVWVLGAGTGGVTFIPARAIGRLAPCPSDVESALIGIKEEAAEAHRVASELEIRLDRVIGELRVTEGLAVGAMEVAGESSEEVAEVAGEVAEVAKEVAEVQERQKAGAPRSPSRTRRAPRKKPRQTVG